LSNTSIYQQLTFRGACQHDSKYWERYINPDLEKRIWRAGDYSTKEGMGEDAENDC